MSRLARAADLASAAITHTAWGCLAAIGLWAWLAQPNPSNAAEVAFGPGANPPAESWTAPLATLGVLLLAAAVGAWRTRRADPPKPPMPMPPWPPGPQGPGHTPHTRRAASPGRPRI